MTTKPGLDPSQTWGYFTGVAALILLVLIPGAFLFVAPDPGAVATQKAFTATALARLWTPLPTQTPYPLFPTPTRNKPVAGANIPTLTPMVPPTPYVTPVPSPLSSTSQVRFAVIGSSVAGQDEAAQLANLVRRWGVEFIATTGNNSVNGEDFATLDRNVGQFYHYYIFPYRGIYDVGASINRFFPALGPEDYASRVKESAFLSFFTLPGNEHYYDVRWGPVHLIILNTVPQGIDGLGKATEQGIWLRNVLLTSAAPWKIVVMHHAPYSSGQNGSFSGLALPFKEWGATAVISGSDLVYERIMVDDFPFFVNGAGVQVLPFSTPLPGSASRFSEKPGAMLISATEDSILFQFHDIFDQIIDTYAIQK